MNKRIWLVLLLVGAIASGALAFGPGGDRRPPSPEEMIGRLAKELNLTAEQKDKFLAGAKQSEAAAKEMMGKNRVIFGEIEKELLKEDPDRNVIHKDIQQISQNDAEIQIQRMDQMIELRKQLTAEQKDKLAKIMQANQEKREIMGTREAKAGKHKMFWK